MNEVRKQRYVFGLGVFTHLGVIVAGVALFVLVTLTIYGFRGRTVLRLAAGLGCVASALWLTRPTVLVDLAEGEVKQRPGFCFWREPQQWGIDDFEAVVLRKRAGIESWMLALEQPDGSTVDLQAYWTRRGAWSHFLRLASATGLARRDDTAREPVLVPAAESAMPLGERLAVHPELLQQYAAIVADPPGTASATITRQDGDVLVYVKPKMVTLARRAHFPLVVVYSVLLAILAVLVFRLNRATGISFGSATGIGLYLVDIWRRWFDWRAGCRATVGETEVTLRKGRRLRAPGSHIPLADIRAALVADGGPVFLYSEQGMLMLGQALSAKEKQWMCAAVVVAIAMQSRPSLSHASNSTPNAEEAPSLTRV